jgi:hypothetical protein
MSKIEHYLKSCCELTRFCSRNGCIDNDSLRYTVIMETCNEIVIDIEFDELLMDGSGNLGGRVRCFGQLHLFLDQLGRVIRAEVL